MIAALLLASIHEERAAARKAELQSKSAAELNDLLVLNGLEGAGGKDRMIKSFLEHEATICEDLKAFDHRAGEIVKNQVAKLEKKNNAQLKEMCVDQALAIGGSKEERIDRLVEQEKKSGVFDAVVSMDMRVKRFEGLIKMTKARLLEACEALEVDPLMKDVMVERIIGHEKENPSIEQPKVKKTRVSS